MVDPRQQVFPPFSNDPLGEAMASPIVAVAFIVGALILAVLAIFAVTVTEDS
jgi:hypothetical protein